MAISPPGDIIMDVARAADPASVEAARARLAEIARGRATGEPFEAQPSAPRATVRRQSDVPETFVKFEAMVLQSFLQSMLPEDNEAVYGEGLAGDMWRSFLANELGTKMAEAGGIGIASRVLGEHSMSGEKKIPVAGLPGAEAKTATAEQSLLSSAAVNEIQRRITRSMGEDLSLQKLDVER